MFRFLADENCNGDIVRGIHFNVPGIDLVRVQDVGCGEASEWTDQVAFLPL